VNLITSRFRRSWRTYSPGSFVTDTRFCFQEPVTSKLMDLPFTMTFVVGSMITSTVLAPSFATTSLFQVSAPLTFLKVRVLSVPKVFSAFQFWSAWQPFTWKSPSLASTNSPWPIIVNLLRLPVNGV